MGGILKLNANSVRRCKWFTKLGQWHPITHGPLPMLHLGVIDGRGGNVTKMRILILREHPEVITVYNPHAEWTDRRRSSFSRRQINRQARSARERNEKEKEKIEKELENERIENLDAEFKDMATSKIIKLTDGADLYSAIEQSKDPQGIFEQLSLS